MPMRKLNGNCDPERPRRVYWVGLRLKSAEERSVDAKVLAICATKDKAERGIIPAMRRIVPLPGLEMGVNVAFVGSWLSSSSS